MLALAGKEIVSLVLVVSLFFFFFLVQADKDDDDVGRSAKYLLLGMFSGWAGRVIYGPALQCR